MNNIKWQILVNHRVRKISLKRKPTVWVPSFHFFPRQFFPFDCSSSSTPHSQRNNALGSNRKMPLNSSKISIKITSNFHECAVFQNSNGSRIVFQCILMNRFFGCQAQCQRIFDGFASAALNSPLLLWLRGVSSSSGISSTSLMLLQQQQQMCSILTANDEVFPFPL